jgi:AAA domain/Bifunctional DNA primase/polymerase, N-terminal
MSTFRDLASALTSRGLSVVPIQPGTKVVHTELCPNGALDAANGTPAGLLQIAIWDRACPAAGVGVVATPDTVFLLDFDDLSYVPPTILDDAFCVETGSGKLHYYFRHFAETRSYGNKAIKGAKDADGGVHEAWSFRGRNQYVVGPGSIHPDTGKPYFIKHDAPITEPSEALLAWLRLVMVKETRVRTDQLLGYALHKEFSPEGFFEHYELKYKKVVDGDRSHYHVHFAGQGCPVAGRVHCVDGSSKPREIEQSTFTFGGGLPPAFHCLSGGCSGNTFKDAVSGLLRANPKFKPYKVWEKEADGWDNEIVLEQGSKIERKDRRYLWCPFIAENQLIHFAGMSTEGKSPVVGDLGARVTNPTIGWPDGQKNLQEPKSVIFMGDEDDVSDTIMPRFDLAKGKADLFFHVKQTHCTNGEKVKDRTFRFDYDMQALRSAAERTANLGLIVVDPITNYLGAAKMNSEEEVRAILMQLAAMAQELTISVWTIGHLNKRERGTDPKARMMGAAAFGGAAREAYIFGADPDSEDKHAHIMVPTRTRSNPG